jgi:HPt (histidine-containing phosphotransfer) domain-containing protein
MMNTLNYQNLVEKFGGRSIARQVCLIFLEEAPALLQEYREQTLESANLESVAALAHRLKGSLGMIELSLSRLANSLERACHKGQRQRAITLYRRLDQGLEALLRDLEMFVTQSSVD